MLGQSWISQRYQTTGTSDEGPLTAAIVRLVSQYRYRWITALLRAEGCSLNPRSRPG